MTTPKFVSASLAASAQRVAAGEVRAVDLAQAALERAAASTSLHAFVELDEADVLAHAQAVDARKAAGDFLLRSAGVPIGISDNIVTTWGRTRAGSRMLGDYRSPFNAHVADRLLTAGLVPFGKTNLGEMGLGHSTETSVFGPTFHPNHAGYLAGGAAGGAAAAVAAGIVPAALAVDTLGSLRQPAAHCGVVGFRPTYGAVSRRGVMALGSSFDAVGVIAGNVQDAAWLFAAIAGHDEWDGTSTPLPAEDVIVELASGLVSPNAPRIGIVRELMQQEMSEASRQAVEQAKAVLTAQGVEVVEVSLPLAETYAATAMALACAEASSNFSRYDGVRFGYRSATADTIDDLYSFSRAEGFGEAVIDWILLGTQLLTAECYESHYRFAQKLRRRIVAEYQAVFAQCDLLLGPATVSTAPRVGELSKDPVVDAQLDRFSAGEALASLPSIVLPAGASNEGLPIGVQLSGAPHSEATLLRVARALELLLNPERVGDEA